MENNMTIILSVVLTALIYMLHKGCVDIKMYSRMPDQINIRIKYWYLMGDMVYLVGTAVCFFSLAYVSNYAGEHGLIGWYFIRALLIGGLIGDEGWDLIFSKTLHNDWLYVIPNWAFGWGFKTIGQRILFDSVRMLLALLLIISYFFI
jgi:hypothetical protein